jgi:L-amino acid N-acyltransferase YncA
MSILRSSHPDDISAITSIYRHHVLHGTGTFETSPPELEEMARRRTEVLERGLPYLVAESEGRVVGYAYCNWFKPRAAYRFSAEDSVYVEAGREGTGIGRALLAELLRQAEAAGVRRVIAVIGDSGNQGSIRLHQSAGFQPAGTLVSCGWKFDRWLDVVMMQRALGLGDAAAPREMQA